MFRRSDHSASAVAILVAFVVAVPLPALADPPRWANTNSWRQRSVPNLNDEAFINSGGCFNWANFLNDDAPALGWSIAYGGNSYVGNPGPSELGATFNVLPSGNPQKFDVWVFYREGSSAGVPPSAGGLQVIMRSIADPALTEGLDYTTELPYVAGSAANVAASPGREPCWSYARIELPNTVPGADYWFCVRWLPLALFDTFSLGLDTDAPHGGVLIWDDGYWHGGSSDPFIVIVQDPTSNEPPTAKINAATAGKTGIPFSLGGSESTAGMGPNGSPDWITSYAWSFVSKPPASNLVGFNPSNQITATFTPDVAGDYQIQLIASDQYEASVPAVHTVTVTQTAPPQIGTPLLSVTAVHAGDTSTNITLSAVVTDEDPAFVHTYLWSVVRRDTLATWTSADTAPTTTLGAMNLSDRGPQQDTYYDVTLTVTNTHPNPDIPNTSAKAHLLVSHWPRITLQSTEPDWVANMHYDLPVVLQIQAGGVGVDIDLARLRLTRPNLTTTLDEMFLPNPTHLAAYQTAAYILTQNDQLLWDPSLSCLSPIPLGPVTATENLAATLAGVVDDNAFQLEDPGEVFIASWESISVDVSVPLYKIVWYGEANRSFIGAVADSIGGTQELARAPAVCALACIAAGPFYPACYSGCIAVHAISAAIQFASEAWGMISYVSSCTDAHDDPPQYDPQYMTVVPLNIAQIDVNAALAPDEPTRLALTSAELGGVVRALFTSYGLTYNKLFGAHLANSIGDPNALDGLILQGTELIRYGAALDRALLEHWQAQSAVQAARGVPDLDQVLAYQQLVAAEGLPQRELDVLGQLGADQSRIDEIAAAIVSADPGVVAAGVSDANQPTFLTTPDLYLRQARSAAPGGVVLVALTEPLPGLPVRGIIDIDARVVHKKENSNYCACGPTLITDVQVDGQNPPLNFVPYPPGPYCPPPPGPAPQATPVQLDTTTLPDGPHTIGATAHDSGICPPAFDPREHVNTDTITIYVDNTPPTLTITSPDADPNLPGIQVQAGDAVTYAAADPLVNGYASGLVDPYQGALPTGTGFGYDQPVRVADRAGNTTETIVQIVATPEGNLMTIDNAVIGDGHLQASLDEYGSMQGIAAPTNMDRYDPPGAVAEATPTYSSATYLFVGNTARELLSASPGWQDNVWDSGSAFSDDTSLTRVVTAANAAADSTPGDGVDDTLTSAFLVAGAVGPNQPVVLAFELTQTVREPNLPGAAYLRQDYQITNLAADALTFTLVRVYDGDLPWVGSPAFADDWVGADQRSGSWYVFQQEPNNAQLAVTLSSLTPPDAYFAGKRGVDPDGAGGDPPFGFGTNVELWDAYGAPAAWQNYVAGVGYDTAGVSGSYPPGGVANPDAFAGLQFDLALQPGAQTTLTLVHSYGTTEPLLPPAGPCPGDADGDRDVDLSDLATVLSQFGQSGAGLAGDVDHDNDVDLSDLAIVLGNFGVVCP